MDFATSSANICLDLWRHVRRDLELEVLVVVVEVISVQVVVEHVTRIEDLSSRSAASGALALLADEITRRRDQDGHVVGGSGAAFSFWSTSRA